MRDQVTLAGYTTLGLGGPAARFVEAGTDEQLIAAVRAADQAGDPLLVLGGGSNLVVADDGFPGTVVRVATRGVRITSGGGRAGTAEVTAAAGENWDELVLRCQAEGLSGVECLSGIPGLAGATPIQNVGAYGQEVAETITAVRAYDRRLGSVTVLSNADCGFGYRTSALKASAAATRAVPGERAARTAFRSVTGRFVVLGVTMRLARDRLSAPVRYAELARVLGVAVGARVPLAGTRAAVLGLRRGKGMVLDPADPDTRSAGSFFTNPVLGSEQFATLQRTVAGRCGTEVSVPRFQAGEGLVKVPAAWLIEHAGFGKGYPAGGRGPRISTKHTLALVNPGGASTAALIGLARQIRDGVRQAFGVELVSEPVLVGTDLG